MKILYVTGGDFAALDVSDNYGIDKAVKLAEVNGGSATIDEDGIYADITIQEFGRVDPKFVSFIFDNIQDYSISKDTDFFVIKEDE